MVVFAQEKARNAGKRPEFQTESCIAVLSKMWENHFLVAFKFSHEKCHKNNPVPLNPQFSWIWILHNLGLLVVLHLISKDLSIQIREAKH